MFWKKPFFLMKWSFKQQHSVEDQTRILLLFFLQFIRFWRPKVRGDRMANCRHSSSAESILVNWRHASFSCAPGFSIELTFSKREQEQHRVGLLLIFLLLPLWLLSFCSYLVFSVRLIKPLFIPKRNISIVVNSMWCVCTERHLKKRSVWRLVSWGCLSRRKLLSL